MDIGKGKVVEKPKTGDAPPPTRRPADTPAPREQPIPVRKNDVFYPQTEPAKKRENIPA